MVSTDISSCDSKCVSDLLNKRRPSEGLPGVPPGCAEGRPHKAVGENSLLEVKELVALNISLVIYEQC